MFNQKKMVKYEIDGLKLKNWKSFHKEFKVKLNFPDYYGENMNAWIDCMDELSKQPTILHIKNGKTLRENKPELLNAILECGAFINYRNIEINEIPHLIISADI